VLASVLYVWLRLRRGRVPDIESLSSDRSAPNDPLMAEGALAADTALPFARNIAAIGRAARADGRIVVLMTLPAGPAVVEPFWRHGIAENNALLRELCTRHGFLLADAEQAFAGRPELAAAFVDLVHLKPPGNRAKAELVADALAGWLDELDSGDARAPAAPR
jgi:hypothetical protein